MTDTEEWREWFEEYRADWDRAEKLVQEGHNRHCAIRMVFGDGMCTCHKTPPEPPNLS